MQSKVTVCNGGHSPWFLAWTPVPLTHTQSPEWTVVPAKFARAALTTAHSTITRHSMALFSTETVSRKERFNNDCVESSSDKVTF